jgi:Ca2+-binding RTX toxin-like protein
MPINDRATTYTFGTAGNDTITAQYLLGDLIDGLAGNDIITGLDGSDTLLGNAGRDTLYGMGGHDTLDGGAGDDRLFGGDGNDIMAGGAGNDYLDGGLGFDAADYRGVTGSRGVTVDLHITKAQNTRAAGYDTIVGVEQVWGSNLNDTITGSEDANHLYGFNGRDIINGAGGDDLIYGGFGDTSGNILSGGDGNDSIDGDAGNDTMRGDAGNDRLTGSLGADRMSGGSGSDRFVFNTIGDSTAAAADTITDFNGAADLIVLQPLQFAGAVEFLGAAAFHVGGAQIRVTSSGGVQLVEVDVDGNTVADMTFNVVGTNLAADDFSYSIFGSGF